MHPDGDGAPPAAARAAARCLTLGAAARTGTFWLMAVAFAATWIPVFIPLVHVVPLAPPGGRVSGDLSDRAILRGTITAAGERR